MKRAVAALVAALAASTTGPHPALADTLVDNVDGLALRADGSVERLVGLVIGNDGRIVQVLHRGEKAGRVDYRVDGKGRVLMPGLVDGHAAVMEAGFAALTLDLTPAGSLAEAQGRVAAYAAAHPDRPWILGRGWNLAAAPSATDLDAAVKDRPAWLVSADGHSGWANTAALAAAGITATTKDPAGGRIARGAGGKPTGLLIEAAMALVARVVPPPRPDDRDLALHAAQELFLARGVTAVSDFGTTIEDWQAYRRAGDAGTLRLRIAAYASGPDAMSLIGGPGPTPWLYNDALRLNGVALVLDGGLGSRGSWLKAPYADSPTSSGLPRMGQTQLRNLMSRAAIDRFQVAVESNGDAAVGAVLDAVKELGETYKGDRRWRLTGAQAVDPADIPRFAGSGIAVTLAPGQIVSLGGAAEARLGAARAGFAWPAASLATASAALSLGSGAPDGARAPFAAMAAATTRQGPDGQPYGGRQPAERITREAALAGWTVNAARALFAEGRFGALTVGARADFILLDRDPLLAGAGELAGTKVLETWISGRRVWAATN